MAQIIELNAGEAKIGTDDGKIVTVPIAALKFANPKVGEQVVVYHDKNEYVVNRANQSEAAPAGSKSVNKHIFVWVFAFLFGSFGVDRFVRGQIGLGVCKLLIGSVFTLGIWPLVDWIISIVKAYGSGNSSDLLYFDTEGNYIK